MIRVTTSAIEQMRRSAAEGGMASMPLRVAVKTEQDGSFHYAMGFDDQRLPGDEYFNFDGIDLVVSTTSKPLADGMTIDYVELEPGSWQFIFLNPNDPDYVPPEG